MTSTGRCVECIAKEEKIERLEKKVKQLEQRIKAIRDAIKKILGIALGLAVGAERKMAKGNLPRATYAYLKGIHKAAGELVKELAKLWIWSKVT